MVFFMYTGMVGDVHDKDSDTVTETLLQNGEFSFDIMDLFFLADFMGISELTAILQQHFITPSCMFSTICSSPVQSEEMAASMLARCSGVENPSLVHLLATAYIKGTGGLSCLCKFPTRSVKLGRVAGDPQYDLSCLLHFPKVTITDDLPHPQFSFAGTQEWSGTP